MFGHRYRDIRWKERGFFQGLTQRQNRDRKQRRTKSWGHQHVLILNTAYSVALHNVGRHIQQKNRTDTLVSSGENTDIKHDHSLRFSSPSLSSAALWHVVYKYTDNFISIASVELYTVCWSACCPNGELKCPAIEQLEHASLQIANDYFCELY